MKKYITTAIDYVNSVPHIGTAYEKIGADVLARFYKLQGHEVVFQMGNDEHSANVQKAAIKKGLDPQVYCDEMRVKFEEAWRLLDISYDQFIQTTEPRHHRSVSRLFEMINAAGDIYPRDYEGWYCESCEAFYTDKDLVEGHCPHHKEKPAWLKEQNYFFKLSKYADFLLNHIETHPHFILPAKRKNEIVQFIKHGLEDISVSRSSFNWGIPLPIKQDHVIYVWFDALINYITGVGFGEDEARFKDVWQNVLHIIGKDITRFHCVIWPAMLKSAGLPLPDMILGHGFFSLKGEKMSKTLGNVVTPMDILKVYPAFGSD
ncbi:MAG: methionine--tRNA ligase, partial [Deltaproteobacteria bacterium]|nr:methionine--tRNA ligase [Deltaproteobacteria bacterium]